MPPDEVSLKITEAGIGSATQDQGAAVCDAPPTPHLDEGPLVVGLQEVHQYGNTVVVPQDHLSHLSVDVASGEVAEGADGRLNHILPVLDVEEYV